MPLVYRGMLPAVGVPGPLVADNNANALGLHVQPPSNAPDAVTHAGRSALGQAVDNNDDPQGISVALNRAATCLHTADPKGTRGTAPVATGCSCGSSKPPLSSQPNWRRWQRRCPASRITPSSALPKKTCRSRPIVATSPPRRPIGTWRPRPPSPASRPLESKEPRLEPHLEQLADSVDVDTEPTDLITALVNGNRRGISAQTLVAGLEAAAQRADDARNDDRAEALRDLLDRITGYCAHSARIQLD